jgi:hypothetical protein
VTADKPGLRIDASGVNLYPGLKLSFQRFRSPLDGLVPAQPRSLGALPVALASNGEVLLPLAEDEAFWIGVRTIPPARCVAFSLAAELANGARIDAVTGEGLNEANPGVVSTLETGSLDGIPCRGGRLMPFARTPYASQTAPLVGLTVEILAAASEGGREMPLERHRASMYLGLVDYEQFRNRTGLVPPSPLNDEAEYKGWRLP